ncbi:MAG: ketopantoate reductase family protein [Anaerolineae bacterium]
MRVAILGTGALGCVFAARLAPHVEVWVLGTWAAGVAAVQERGVLIHEPDGRRTQVQVAAVGDPAAAPTVDFALVLVKSYQTDRAAAWAARILAGDGLAVTLQNGLDNGPRLATAVGAERTAVGVTYTAATLLGPGEARLVSVQPTFIGRARRAETLVALLNAAGLEAHVADDIEARLWAKAVANAAINPLAALWRVPNGDLLATAERRALLAALATEAAAVARGRGLHLPFADPVVYVEGVCRATAANRSSMLQDAMSGRPTEIASINGVLIAEGRRLGIPTPVNEVVWQLVRGLREDEAPERPDSGATGTTHPRTATFCV